MSPTVDKGDKIFEYQSRMKLKNKNDEIYFKTEEERRLDEMN